MIISRLISIILRLLQLASAAIVTGIIGDYISYTNQAGVSPGDRFVYTIVIAAFSLLTSLILLVPFTASLTVFPLDFLFFILWIVSFGLVVDFIAPMNCEWGWSWNGRYYLSEVDQCQRWKACLAFIFLSAMFWLMSAILALWVVYRTRGRVGERRWYRSHY
ncbi:marvel domain-containing protein [Tirmania nivea]|nr:marvel domain-containing protein [Tirmania nivea]